MKRRFKLLILLISAFIFSINVNAEDAYAEFARSWISGESSIYTKLSEKYSSSSLTKYTVDGSRSDIMVYGKSECDFTTNKCTFSYQNGYTLEEILSSSITCSNNEGYVYYNKPATTSDNYKEDFISENQNIPDGETKGTVMWSEQYTVKCQTEGTGDNIVNLNNQITTSPVSTDNSYSSSTTEQSPETGVETYYIILGLIAVISYIFMLCVKKYNLFKKI